MKLCALCCVEFIPVREHQVYCCNKHRLAAGKRTKKVGKRVSSEYKPRVPKKETRSDVPSNATFLYRSMLKDSVDRTRVDDNQQGKRIDQRAIDGR